VLYRGLLGFGSLLVKAGPYLEDLLDAILEVGVHRLVRERGLE
jgi:hypothetical protein